MDQLKEQREAHRNNLTEEQKSDAKYKTFTRKLIWEGLDGTQKIINEVVTHPIAVLPQPTQTYLQGTMYVRTNPLQRIVINAPGIYIPPESKIILKSVRSNVTAPFSSEKFDPFEKLPEEIVNNILKYINKADVLQCSLVSKRWNDYIGKSKDCMKKLKLTCSYQNYEKNIEFLLNSGRLYQNLKFLFRSNDLTKNREVTTNMRSIVNKFSSSLKSIETTHDLQRIFDLPKLKELSFSSLYVSRYSRLNSFATSSAGFLGKSKSLEKLTFNCDTMDNISVKFLKRNLKKFECLKVLKTIDSSFLKNWNADDCKFQLEQFHWTGYLWNTETLLVQFLNSQNSTLNIIHFHDPTFQYVSSFMANFPKLQKLSLSGFYYKNSKDAYPINYSIEELKIDDHHGDVENFSMNVTEIMAQLKNLKVLKVCDLHEPILNAVLESKTIKAVEYRRAGKISYFQKILLQQKMMEQVTFIKRRCFEF